MHKDLGCLLSGCIMVYVQCTGSTRSICSYVFSMDSSMIHFMCIYAHIGLHKA